MVTIAFVYNRWTTSELNCFVNGNLVSRAEMSWPVNTNDVSGWLSLNSDLINIFCSGITGWIAVSSRIVRQWQNFCSAYKAKDFLAFIMFALWHLAVCYELSVPRLPGWFKLWVSFLYLSGSILINIYITYCKDFLKVKGKGIQVLYSDHLASTLCGWDPSPPLVRLNGRHAI